MVRLIVRMTVYQHISLFQNLPIFQLVSVHCSNVHVSNLQSICEYNDYTLTNVLVSGTTLQLIFETQVYCLCSKHKYTVYVPITDKGLFCPMCQMYYYNSNIIASEAFFPSPDNCAQSSSLATRIWVCSHVVDSCATRWITADRVYSQLGWHPSVLVASALAHWMAGTIPL